MSSLRLQTSLRQQMVLTPQLRQRIEMLQMTSVELSDLIQEEMLSNPVLEEVQTDEEYQDISEKILDQNADGHEENLTNGHQKEDLDFASEVEKQTMDFSTEMPLENGLNLPSVRQKRPPQYCPPKQNLPKSADLL